MNRLKYFTIHAFVANKFQPGLHYVPVQSSVVRAGVETTTNSPGLDWSYFEQVSNAFHTHGKLYLSLVYTEIYRA